MSSKMKAAWSGKTGAWVAAGVLAVALVVMLVAIGLRLTGPGDDSSSEQNSGGSAPAPAGPAGETCEVAEGDQSWRAPAPKDLTWKSAQGLSWPVSASVGPTKKVKGFDACFAHSPQGASLAVTNFIYSQFDGHKPAQLIDFYGAESPKKAQEVTGKAGDSNSADDIRKLGLTPAGYLVESYTDSQADVKVVFTLPQASSKYLALSYRMKWDGNDWKLDLETPTRSQEVQDGQFVKWSS